MNNNIELTIGISTWNRAACLQKLLLSIENQDFDSNKMEVIIADSNSDDGTVEVIKSFSKRINIKHLNVENTPVEKRNAIITNAIGNTIILLDDDVCLANTSFLSSHFNANLNNKDSFYCGDVCFDKTMCEVSNYYYFRNNQHVHKKKDKELEFNRITTMNMSGPKKLFIQVGLFNRHFIGYGCEDLEYGYRIIDKGFRLIFLKSALVIHNEQSSNIIEYGRKMYLNGLYGSRVLKTECYNAWKKMYKNKMFLKPIFNSFFLKNKLEKYLVKNDLKRNKYSYKLFKHYLYCCFFNGVRDQKQYPILTMKDKEKEW